MKKSILSHSTTIAAILTAAIFAGTCSAAAPATNAPAPKKGWETVAAAGATLTRGNSKTFLVNLDLNTKRKWSRDEALLGTSAGYGENETGTRAPDDNDKNVTQKYIKGFAQYNHLFNERLYSGL